MQRLEIRASKSSAIFAICIYLLAFFGLPLITFLGFGPGAAGDTALNGNSIWVFWLMRIVLAAMWIACVFSLVKFWRLMRKLPVLFVLDKIGIMNHDGIATPWIEFRRAYWNRRGWTFHLDVKPKSEFKKFVLKQHEIGYSSMEDVRRFIRQHAPTELTRDLD